MILSSISINNITISSRQNNANFYFRGHTKPARLLLSSTTPSSTKTESQVSSRWSLAVLVGRVLYSDDDDDVWSLSEAS